MFGVGATDEGYELAVGIGYAAGAFEFVTVLASDEILVEVG